MEESRLQSGRHSLFPSFVHLAFLANPMSVFCILTVPQMESEHYLSYPQWMKMKLCYTYPEFLGVYNSVMNRQNLLPQSEATNATGNLEKLYGIALKGFITAKNSASNE
jgi:hypothetical protein